MEIPKWALQVKATKVYVFWGKKKAPRSRIWEKIFTMQHLKKKKCTKKSIFASENLFILLLKELLLFYRAASLCMHTYEHKPFH